MPLYGQFLRDGAPIHGQVDGETVRFMLDLFGEKQFTGESAPLGELEILPPVFPSKLFAIGLNYAEHAREQGNEVPDEPLMWFKAPSSLLAHAKTIEIAFPDHRTDYEAELAIVVGKRGKAISQSAARAHIFGYTAAQDVSDRKIQRSESQWARAKSLDTYTPLGPFISTDLDVSALPIQSVVNGEVRQRGNTRDMIFRPECIVEFVSRAITLKAGDAILTGTPAGVGPLRDGDVLETRIEGLAVLQNLVKAAN